VTRGVDKSERCVRLYENVTFCRMKHVAAFLTSDSKSKKPSQVETWATPTLQPPVRQTRSDLPRVLYNFSDHKPTGKPQRDVPTSTSTPTRPEKQSQTSPQVVRHDWRSPTTVVSDESTSTEELTYSETSSDEDIDQPQQPPADMASEAVNLSTPPAFSGQQEDDPVDWLRRFEKFCSFKGIANNKKRDLMLYLMVGNAADWVEHIADDKKDTIANLLTSFHQRYDESEYLQHKNAKIMFERKQQPNERVEDFITQMRKLATQVGLDEKATKYTILNGLRPAIAAAVIQKESKTVDEILATARLAESAGLATTAGPSTVNRHAE